MILAIICSIGLGMIMGTSKQYPNRFDQFVFHSGKVIIQILVMLLSTNHTLISYLEFIIISYPSFEIVYNILHTGDWLYCPATPFSFFDKILNKISNTLDVNVRVLKLTLYIISILTVIII